MGCPICGKEMPGDTCSCGYDRTRDYSRYPTISKLTNDDILIIQEKKQAPAAVSKTQYVDSAASNGSGYANQAVNDHSAYVNQTASNYSAYVNQPAGNDSGYVDQIANDYSGYADQTASNHSAYVNQPADNNSGYADQTISNYSGYADQTISDYSGYADQIAGNYSVPAAENSAYSKTKSKYQELKDSEKIANILLYLDLAARFLLMVYVSFVVLDMDSDPEVGEYAYVAYSVMGAIMALLTCPRGFVKNHSEKHLPGVVAAWATIPTWVIGGLLLLISEMGPVNEDIFMGGLICIMFPSVYFIFSNISWLQNR